MIQVSKQPVAGTLLYCPVACSLGTGANHCVMLVHGRRIALRLLSTEAQEAIHQNASVTEQQMQHYVSLASRGLVSWPSAFLVAGGAAGLTGLYVNWTASDMKGTVATTVAELKETVATKDGVHAEIAGVKGEIAGVKGEIEGVKAQLTVQGKDIENLRSDMKEVKDMLKNLAAKA
jgi:hypothetical protein